MKSLTSRAARIAAVGATPVAILAAAGMVLQSSNAAFTGQTRNSGNNWSTGAVALTDDDAGAARFQVEGMVPGDTGNRCIKVTANTNVDGTVKGYAVNPVRSSNGLENRIIVKMEAGSGGGFGSCDGFVSEQTIIPNITLAQMFTVDSYDAGVGGWNVSAGTSSRTYKLTWTFDTTGMTQAEVDQLQGSRTGVDMQWELQSS
jgi:hypothetical protein